MDGLLGFFLCGTHEQRLRMAPAAALGKMHARASHCFHAPMLLSLLSSSVGTCGLRMWLTVNFQKCSRPKPISLTTVKSYLAKLGQ